MILSYKQHIKNTISLAYPVVIGQLGHVMMGVVDSFMVGKIGAVPLAASAIANGLFFLVFVIGLGVTFAISPLVAISNGAGKENDCSNILRQGLVVNVVIGILLTLLIIFGADLIKYMNQPKDVSEQAIIFLKIVGLSMLPLMVFQTFRQFIEGFSVMYPAMIITIIANLVNGFVNWLLIYGNLGFPRLELAGSGISNLINRIFMAVAIIIYVFNSKKFRDYNLSLRIRFLDFQLIKKILKLGLPSGFQYFFEVGAFSFSAIMIGWLGTKALAAHQIAMSLASITYMAATGISAAGAIRVGNAVGAGNITETRRSGFAALILVISMMALFALIFIVFRNALPTIYISDNEVISVTATLLVIAAFFQIFDGSQAVGLGILRGLTDVKIPTAITFIAYWIIMIPAGYILAFKFQFGIQGIWSGYILGLVASAFLLNIRFNVRSKKKIHL
ncbi:MAG: MATE family efflux transporter [Ignavibacteriales bacterium]|nr:MATE family efflux transporter [Ignavibacteriales bacterium]